MSDDETEWCVEDHADLELMSFDNRPGFHRIRTKDESGHLARWLGVTPVDGGVLEVVCTGSWWQRRRFRRGLEQIARGDVSAQRNARPEKGSDE